ncbi:hypothetical protein VM98_26610 [Streptomyces rubellomurinus subsp. indigoferus]|nr:hypothetical protein VM98_26610 [Streptomyces rubellomurinus subsp. indigoferus]
MRKRIQTLTPSGLIPHPSAGTAVPAGAAAEPVFVGIDVDVFTRMAWDCLGADTPVARRERATALGRAYLAEAVNLPLKTMGIDDLALVILHLRTSLAQLLTVIDHHTAVRPAEPDGDLDADDLVADLLDVIAGTAGLNAGVAIDIAQPLPAHLINVLAQAIGAPGVRTSGTVVEAIGSCGTSAVRVTATRSQAA